MDKNEDEVCIDIKNEFNSEMNKEINDYLENNHDYDDCLEKKMIMRLWIVKII